MSDSSSGSAKRARRHFTGQLKVAIVKPQELTAYATTRRTSPNRRRM